MSSSFCQLEVIPSDLHICVHLSLRDHLLDILFWWSLLWSGICSSSFEATEHHSWDFVSFQCIVCKKTVFSGPFFIVQLIFNHMEHGITALIDLFYFIGRQRCATSLERIFFIETISQQSVLRIKPLYFFVALNIFFVVSCLLLVKLL